MRLENVIRNREVVEELERSGRGQIERQKKRFDEDNILENKITQDHCLSLWPIKGSRAIYCSEKNPRSRIKEVGSGSQVIRRDAILSFYSYYFWEFGSFLCFFSFVVSLLCNPNKILQSTKGTRILSPIISPIRVTRAQDSRRILS